MEDVDTLNDDVNGLHDAYVLLQNYVNDYFSTLDVQVEINNKLDEMATAEIITEYLTFLNSYRGEMKNGLADFWEK